MPVRSCRVTIQDMDGVSHTVEITAATLYEAVAQGLAAIRASEWVAGIAQGLNVVKVSVADIRVEHEVKLMDFTKWLEKNGGSPREVSDRQKIRSILGMPISRYAKSHAAFCFKNRRLRVKIGANCTQIAPGESFALLVALQPVGESLIYL